ncbi:MAG TPA: hypothetical protein VFP95_02375, partial [Gammaproteobacteria bacterium]|nr:hypothetical protein [Gammaproteobacteria bacterium]
MTDSPSLAQNLTDSALAGRMEADRLEYDERILRALRRIIRAVDLYSRQLSHRHTLTGPQLV